MTPEMIHDVFRLFEACALIGGFLYFCEWLLNLASRLIGRRDY